MRSQYVYSEVSMKVAVIGSRGLCVFDLGKYLPENTTEIVWEGLKGWIPRQENTHCRTELS